MKTVLAAAFWVLVGAALVLSIHSANNISNNLKSIEGNLDRINIMLKDMSSNAEKNNEILKELTDGK
jgi:hypothetical protein